MRNRSIQLGRLHFHHTLLDWVGRWPLGVIAYRRRVLYLNEAAAQLLGGQRRRDLIGRPIGRIYRPDAYSPFAGVTRQRALLRRLDGQDVPVRRAVFPRAHAGARHDAHVPVPGHRRGTRTARSRCW